MAGLYTREVTHVVLTDGAVPYLLARVRWPDVAQATTVGNRTWLDDPGLFDLRYSPNAVPLTFGQAASVAAGWGMQLGAEPASDAPSFIRRMPANWSDLSPVERRAFGIEFAGKKRASARHVRRLRAYRAKVGASSVSPPVNGQDINTATSAAATTSRIEAATERRRHVRVRVDGRAHVRFGSTTVSADLVDLSEGGMRCVQPASPQLATGVTFDGPILLEARAATSRICLNVAGRIAWHRSVGASTHFGVAFEELTSGETDGLQWFLGVVCSKRGTR